MNQSLWNAFWEVKRGDVKANEAAQQNGVARSTLYSRLKNPLPRPVGRPFNFEDHDEILFVNSIGLSTSYQNYSDR